MLSREFINAFRIQARVVRALLLREIITRYGRHNIGFLWLFLEPMMFTLGVTTVWTAMKVNHGSSLPITAFAVTGYSSLLLWRNCSSRAVKAIEANHSLMFHRNVKVLDIFIARNLLEIAGATVSLSFLSFVFSVAGLMSPPSDILTVMLGWFLLAWFAFALSLVVGALSEWSEMVERVWHILTYLMFPLSGAAFMVDWMPSGAHKYLLLVPMVNGTEMIRHGFFGETIKTYEDPYYLLIVNSVLFLVGLFLIDKAAMKVEPQ